MCSCCRHRHYSFRQDLTKNVFVVIIIGPPHFKQLQMSAYYTLFGLQYSRFGALAGCIASQASLFCVRRFS